MKLLYFLLIFISVRHLHVHAMHGGNYVEIKELPHQAQVFHSGGRTYTHRGATIISEYWLVTAAHGIGDADFLPLQVRVGSSTQSKGTIIDISKIIIHGDYTGEPMFDNDICLIKTKTPIEFNEYQQPIPIAKEAPKVGEIVTTSGFGNLHYGISGISLQVTNVPVIEVEACKKQLKCTTVTNNMFCTNASRVDLCPGDSGSPAILNGKLVGVVSQGCEYTEPNVFVKVSNYYDWIIQQTGIKYDN